jgi:hypothetical protein
MAESADASFAVVVICPAKTASVGSTAVLSDGDGVPAWPAAAVEAGLVFVPPDPLALDGAGVVAPLVSAGALVFGVVAVWLVPVVPVLPRLPVNFVAG